MRKSKVKLVNPKAFTVNLPGSRKPVTIRTKGDEIVVNMSFTIRPRDNVVNIGLDVSADGTTMSSLYKNTSPENRGDWWTLYKHWKQKEAIEQQQNEKQKAKAQNQTRRIAGP